MSITLHRVFGQRVRRYLESPMQTHIPFKPNVFSFVMSSGTMSNTAENENEHFSLFFGHDFYIEPRSKHYATISSQKSQQTRKRNVRALQNYETSLQAVKNLLVFTPFSRSVSSFVSSAVVNQKLIQIHWCWCQRWCYAIRWRISRWPQSPGKTIDIKTRWWALSDCQKRFVAPSRNSTMLDSEIFLTFRSTGIRDSVASMKWVMNFDFWEVFVPFGPPAILCRSTARRDEKFLQQLNCRQHNRCYTWSLLSRKNVAFHWAESQIIPASAKIGKVLEAWEGLSKELRSHFIEIRWSIFLLKVKLDIALLILVGSLCFLFN